MALPVYRAAGAIASGTGAISPGLPANIEVGDLLVMFVETSNQDITVSGWNTAGSTPISETTDNTRLTVFWKRAVGGDATTTSDSGDHQIARIVAIRGVIGSGDPFHITNSGTDTTSDTSGSIPGGTTTINDCFVLVAASAGNDPASNGTANFSSWTNADLASLTERIDNVRVDGNGGGIGVATGTKATAGTIGTTAVTYAVATRKAMWMGALLPTVAAYGNFSDNFDDNSIDTTKWSNWGGAQVAETSGKLVITIPTTTSNYYGMEAAGRWSLVGSRVLVQIVSISDTTPDELEVEFQVIATATPSNRVFFLISGHATTPVLHAYKEVAGTLTDAAQVNYNSATMQYLQIRESGGTTFWEYSATGAAGSWTTLHSESNPITLTDCSIQLDSGCWDTTHGQVVVTYDNFNVEGSSAVTLVVPDLSVATSMDSIALTQKHTLSVADLALSTSIDSIALTQKHTLSVQDSLVSTVIDNSSLTQKHTLVVSDLAVSSSIDVPTPIMDTLLAIGDMLVSTFIDPIAVTQKHNLSVQDSSILTSIDSPILVEDTILVVQDITISTSMDSVALTQKHNLVVQDLTVSTLIDNSILTQKHNISVQDLAITTSIDSPNLSGAQTLTVQDIAISTSIDVPTLSQKHTLVVQDLLVSTSIDSISISQKHNLSVADLAISTSIEQPSLSGAQMLSVNDILVSTSMDPIALTQKHTLVVQDLSVLSMIDAFNLFQNHLISVSDLSISTSIDVPTLIQDIALVVQDLLIQSTIDNNILTQKHTLSVQDMLVSVVFDSIGLVGKHTLIVNGLDVSTAIDNVIPVQGAPSQTIRVTVSGRDNRIGINGSPKSARINIYSNRAVVDANDNNVIINSKEA